MQNVVALFVEVIHEEPTSNQMTSLGLFLTLTIHMRTLHSLYTDF